jgi:hypothetical protein
MAEFKRTVRLLYTGQRARARRFRYGLIAFDAISIVYFIASVPMPQSCVITVLNAVLGLVIVLDLAARLWISDNRRRELTRIYTLAPYRRGLAASGAALCRLAGVSPRAPGAAADPVLPFVAGFSGARAGSSAVTRMRSLLR